MVLVDTESACEVVVEGADMTADENCPIVDILLLLGLTLPMRIATSGCFQSQ